MEFFIDIDNATTNREAFCVYYSLFHEEDWKKMRMSLCFEIVYSLSSQILENIDEFKTCMYVSK